MGADLNVKASEKQAEGDFVYLGALLAKGVSPGQLATAIETHGIFGPDDYGRVQHGTKPSAIVASALALLKRRWELISRPQYAYDGGMDDPVDNPYWWYGWPAAALPGIPDWNDDDIGLVIVSKRGGRPRKDAAVLAALWGIVRGKLDCQPHPQFGASNEDIIDHIVRRSGLDVSEVTLQRAFGDCAKLLVLPAEVGRQNSP